MMNVFTVVMAYSITCPIIVPFGKGVTCYMTYNMTHNMTYIVVGSSEYIRKVALQYYTAVLQYSTAVL